MSGPFFNPTDSFYPRAQHFPNIDPVQTPFVTPDDGVFVVSVAGALFSMNANGLLQPIAGGGAIGAPLSNGVDDTAALTDFLNSVPAGSLVGFPTTTYKISGAGLTIAKPGSYVGGGLGTRFDYISGNASPVTVAVGIGAAGKTYVQGLTATVSGGTPLSGFAIVNSSFVQAVNLAAFQFPIGIDVLSSYLVNLDHCYSDAQAIGDNTPPTANTKIGFRFTTCNACDVTNESVVFRTNTGVQLIGCSACTVDRGDVEYSGTPVAGSVGVEIRATPTVNAFGNVVRELWLEDMDTGILLNGSDAASGSGVYGTQLLGGSFNTLAGVWNAMHIVQATGTTINGPTAPVLSPNAQIVLDANADNTAWYNVPTASFVAAGVRSPELVVGASLPQVLANNGGTGGIVTQRHRNNAANAVDTKYVEVDYEGVDTVSTVKTVASFRVSPNAGAINWSDSILQWFGRQADAITNFLSIGPNGNIGMGRAGAPNNAWGADGELYVRTDGGAGTTIYQKRTGVWVGIV